METLLGLRAGHSSSRRSWVFGNDLDGWDLAMLTLPGHDYKDVAGIERTGPVLCFAHCKSASTSNSYSSSEANLGTICVAGL